MNDEQRRYLSLLSAYIDGGDETEGDPTRDEAQLALEKLRTDLVNWPKKWAQTMDTYSSLLYKEQELSESLRAERDAALSDAAEANDAMLTSESNRQGAQLEIVELLARAETAERERDALRERALVVIDRHGEKYRATFAEDDGREFRVFDTGDTPIEAGLNLLRASYAIRAALKDAD